MTRTGDSVRFPTLFNSHSSSAFRWDPTVWSGLWGCPGKPASGPVPAQDVSTFPTHLDADPLRFGRELYRGPDREKLMRAAPLLTAELHNCNSNDRFPALCQSRSACPFRGIFPSEVDLPEWTYPGCCGTTRRMKAADAGMSCPPGPDPGGNRLTDSAEAWYTLQSAATICGCVQGGKPHVI